MGANGKGQAQVSCPWCGGSNNSSFGNLLEGVGESLQRIELFMGISGLYVPDLCLGCADMVLRFRRTALQVWMMA